MKIILRSKILILKVIFVLNFCLAISMLLYIPGCRKSATEKEEEMFQMTSIAFCKEILQNPRRAEHTKSLAQNVLQLRENNRLDTQPILVHALLTQPEGKRYFCICFGISDEDGDVAGIGIRERHKTSDGRFVIEEKYPIFGYQIIKPAGYQIIPVKIRKNSEKKNEKDWENYVNGKVWKRETMPDFWVSIPEPDLIETEVWLYDRAGNQSEPVELENKLE